MQIGDKFNLLTVIGIHGPRGGRLLVRCDCGEEKFLLRANVLTGAVKSCGCFKSVSASQRRKTHGEVKHIDGKRCPSPEYRTWQNMRNRCLNKHAHDYKYYGGRGIKIAEEWGEFEKFLADMGRRPSSKHTLDRIDSNGDYTPENCRWETRQVQARNRDYAKTQAWELAERLGIKYMTASHYIWQVRAKDKGRTAGIVLSPSLEQTVRAFIKEKGI